MSVELNGTMKMYSSRTNTCPKCRESARVFWHMHGCNPAPLTGPRFKVSFEGEHMHRQCLTCFFEWPEKPLVGNAWQAGIISKEE